jgi:hypothetical protein
MEFHLLFKYLRALFCSYTLVDLPDLCCVIYKTLKNTANEWIFPFISETLVAHTYNFSYLRGWFREDHGSNSDGEKVSESSFQRKKVGHGGTHLTSQLHGNQSWRIAVQARMSKKWDPISKTVRAKRAGGGTQAVERLRSHTKNPKT